MSETGQETLAGCLLEIFVGLLIIPLAAVFAHGWNEVVPGVFGLPELGYWQAFWLLLISRLILPSRTYLVRRS